MDRTAAFHTLGCKVNRYETDAIAQTFERAGFSIKDFNESADVYVINTCTVTAEADRKSRQMLRQAKKRNPDSLVIAMGCHVEQSDASEYADILIGNDEKMKAVEIVLKIIENRKKSHSKENPGIRNLVKTADAKKFEEMGIVTSQEETRAFMKIEDGCNNFCSYCIIPYVRGRVRSRDESAILQEAQELANKGFQEIVLTGIHICSYGAENGFEKDSLIGLTEKLAAIKKLRRIRFGSLEPQSITLDFILKASEIGSLCPHFHISLQSGSDSVLQRMNRHYSTNDFIKTVNMIREQIPDAMITTDIITGFPGESEEEHLQTLDFCKKADFLSMHVFKFSPRKGTKAALMTGHVDPQTINRRSKELIELAQQMKEEHFRNAAGKRFRVLVETIGPVFASGYTENYMPAKISIDDKAGTDDFMIGSIVDVTAVGYDNESIHLIKM
ncbi:MAG: tRNA (N(6)-L-threonylcarbamoyladenosine(37)-C(2))-methylthiotransferase MtaB [Saccharofermentanales bacterium]